MRAGLIATGTALALVFLAEPALGADRVYWNWATLSSGVAVAGGISSANLDGSAGQGLTPSGAPLDHPLGVAIDSATGTIYWSNFGSSTNYCSGPLNGGNSISFATLDGTAGGTLNTTGATVSGPDGVALDPVAGRLYWANDHADSISYANLNGSGGHDLNTTGATLDCPAGVAIDPAVGRVYWTNFKGNTISYANLDGSGGGDLPIPASIVNGPYGLAIDAGTGRLYWANNLGNSISYANLDGSGGDNLSTPGATVNGPWGVAIDPAAGRIYWANNLGASISYASLDESGGADLGIAGAPVDHPKYPVLLGAPIAAGAPVIHGGSTTGSKLFCSSGTWARDLPESFLYRAPQSFAYSWSRNGAPIAGTSSSIIAGSSGGYACRSAASNYAGSTVQTSAVFTVLRPPPNTIKVTPLTVSRKGAITLAVRVNAPGKLKGSATFTRKATRVVYGSASLTVTGAGTWRLTIRPTRAARKLLKPGRKLKLALVLGLTGTNGTVTRARLHVSVSAS